MRIIDVVFLVGVGALVVALLVTRRDLTQPQLRIFTEMDRSPAYKAQSENPVFKNRSTVQAPVEGTVARGQKSFKYGPTEAERTRAGRELTNPESTSLAVLDEGRQNYENFCSHCHGPRGAGDGPVAQRVPAFAMSIVGKATRELPDGMIFHIVTHGRNNMPPHATQLTATERWRLIRFLRDMQRGESERLARQGIIEELEDPRPGHLVSAEYGTEIYVNNCQACHGEAGRHPVQGVPTLNAPRVLAVADDDYYRQIISHGRKGTKMAAWDKILTPTQIQSLVLHIRGWQPLEVQRGDVAVARGDVRRGGSLFRGNCAACHGLVGEGGIGNRLRSPSFQALASDEFLRDTVARGRGHTAMPAGNALGADEVSDILAFMRSWMARPPTFEQVKDAQAKASPEMGAKVFQGRCASCHGTAGQGGVGNRLAGNEFLGLASDEFLFRAIVEGRPGTAMPAWSFLKAQDVADLIAHLRGWQTSPAARTTGRVVNGRPEFGEILYRQGCISCHGPEGRGGVGPQVTNRVFLESATDEFLWRTIATGRSGTAMRGFLAGTAAGGELMSMSAADIDHVVAYLRKVGSQRRIDPMRRPHQVTSIARGKEVYETKASCAKCHGFQGEGASGPALGNPDFLKVASDGFLIGTIMMGRENTAMPAFWSAGMSGLTRGDVEDVVAYLRTFENRPMTAKRRVEHVEADRNEGKELFASHCASCHGSDGRGPVANKRNGYAPSLNNPQFLKAADDSLLLATIALGRPGTPMRSFARGAGGISELSGGEIRRIVAFMRSWEDQK